jgi:hypothetical protein
MMSAKILKDNAFKAVGESGLDDRRRVTLTKAVDELRIRFQEEPGKLHFSIYLNKAGQILLSPETKIPLHEAWLYRNPEALNMVLRGIAQAKEGKLKVRESFAEARRHLEGK